VVGKTWAPRGETPVLEGKCRWDKLSIIGGITACGRVLQRTFEQAIKGVQVVAFCEHLLQHIEGEIIVVLDRAPIHRSKVVKDFLESEEGRRLTVTYLPSYAPECNPIEWLWAYIKTRHLANFCPVNLAELKQAWRKALARIRLKPDLVASFFRASAIGQT
jgi:transposase